MIATIKPKPNLDDLLKLPETESILAIFLGQRVEIFTGATQLPVLDAIQLELTVEQVFSWLKFSSIKFIRVIIIICFYVRSSVFICRKILTNDDNIQFDDITHVLTIQPEKI